MSSHFFFFLPFPDFQKRSSPKTAPRTTHTQYPVAPLSPHTVGYYSSFQSTGAELLPLITKMCLDIEHDLKVQMLKDIENDTTTDGYDIVYAFLCQNSYIIGKLKATSASPFTSDLIRKYFTFQRVYNSQKEKNENQIIAYDDCPAWVLLEMLTFGDFIKFYEFYYFPRSYHKLSSPVINLVKSLRNGAAHNNCISADLAHGTSRAPGEVSHSIAQIPFINRNQRQKKLSCQPMLEFVDLLYTYNLVVSDKVKHHRTLELKNLFFDRMLQKKDFS